MGVIEEGKPIRCYKCKKNVKSDEHPYYCSVLRVVLKSEGDMRKYQSLCDVDRWLLFHKDLDEQVA